MGVFLIRKTGVSELNCGMQRNNVIGRCSKCDVCSDKYLHQNTTGKSTNDTSLYVVACFD
jgi:hypothetical protein